MRRSEARRRLSLMIAAYGVDGSLVVPNSVYDPGAEGADLAPGDALKWPPCVCGHPSCPDSAPRPGEDER
ncbi:MULTISPECIES: hypothetical protein [unclassified Streptomyces]|uniref:hypothetical protein n=1 Tax=unclassified Streptomyces TaxID=2593676 RepID=UPI00201F1155|nr:hypothetical protein [Streptomyces sp. 35G-GA-8]MCL7377112.1 hypothetical protein [Streptomyces sp. 35G-GA-8]